MMDGLVATHIFISHSSTDNAYVQRLTADLRHVGIPIWVDHQELKPGTRNWEKAIRAALKKSRALIYIGSLKARESDYVQDELSIAEMEGCTLLAAWAIGEDGHWLDCVPLGYGKLQYVDMRGEKYESGLKDLLTVLSDVPPRPVSPPPIEAPPSKTKALDETPDLAAPPETKPITDIPLRNPYKALDAFTEANAPDFFGRDELIATLHQRIEAFPSFLAVIGASGSGKSSVVMAGLIPRLKTDHPDWIILPPVKPGAHPVEALAIVLQKAYFPQGSVSAVREDLETADTRGLLVRTGAIPRPPKARVAVFVDQFEEVFTQAVSEAEREQFIHLLTTVVAELASAVTVLLTLRADFYDRILGDSELGRLIKEHGEPVLPMSITDLKQTIERPAELVGLKFDDGLVADLVFETRDQVGALPLLQFTLDQLFQQRDGVSLTRSAYERLGGVQGAISKQAEDTFDTLDTEEQRLARGLFLRLIEPGATEQDTTRRRAPLRELTLTDPAQTERLRQVADTFVKARLLTTDTAVGEDTIEVSHEALIREWPRLKAWLNSAREDVLLMKRIAADANEWATKGKSEDALYRGRRLRDAQDWASNNAPSLQESAFIAASEAAEEAQIAAEEQRKAELRQAAERAEQATNQSKKAAKQAVTARWLALMTGIVALIVAVLAGLFASRSISDAQQRVFSAEIRERDSSTQVAVANATLVSASVQLEDQVDKTDQQIEEANSLIWTNRAQAASINSQPDLARLFSLEANQISLPPLQAQRALATYGYSPGTSHLYLGHTDWVWSVAISPDGNRLASASFDRTVLIWDLATGEILHRLTEHSGVLFAVAFSADGRFLISGGCGISTSDICQGELVLWDTENGSIVKRFPPLGSGVRSIAYHPDGIHAYVGLEDGRILRINTILTEVDEEYPIHHSNTQALAVAPDGQSVVTAGCGARLLLYDPTSQCTQVEIFLWKTEDGSILQRYTGPTDDVLALAFSPDGTQIAASSRDTSVRIWTSSTGQEVFSIEPRVENAHTDWVWDVAFSPDGRQLVSVSADKSIRLWDIDSQALLNTFWGHAEEVTSVVFHPDGNHFITGARDSTLRQWDITNGEFFASYQLGASRVNALAFSTNGEYVVSGSDTSLSMEQLETPDTVTVFPNSHTAEISRVVSLPHQPAFISASYDNTLILWNAQNQTIQGHFEEGYGGAILGLAVSPDGQLVLAGGGGNNYRLWLWNTQTQKVVREFTGHNNWITSVAFAPDGQTALSGSLDHTAILWDVATGNILHRFAGHDTWILSVAISPDGHYAATGSLDGVVILWDLETSNTIFEITTHTDAVKDLLFTPDSNYLLRVGEDGQILLWSVKDQVMVRNIGETTDGFTSIAMDIEGRYVATGTETGQVYIWRLGLDELMQWIMNNRFVPCPQQRDYSEYQLESSYSPNCEGAQAISK
jgi:WD40 repeat protein